MRHPDPPDNDQPLRPSVSERWRLAWLLLVVVYTMFALLFSVIQPLTAPPDEAAHMHYVRFLVEERRLPLWSPQGGGEAGYEAQHPPLAYALQAIPYALSASQPEAIRWHAVRWLMVALGWLLLFIIQRLGRRLFPKREGDQFVLVATVLLMPLTLLYLCHANPDGIALILGAAALLTAQHLYTDKEEHPALPWTAGLLAACAGLTKLSAAPLGLLLVLAQWFRPQQAAGNRLRRCAIILGVGCAGAGWWYVRNVLQHGTPFIHTPSTRGSGWELAEVAGPARTAAFTLFETYVSTWVQRGWLAYPLDAWLFGLVTLVLLAAIAGFVKSRKGRKQVPIDPCLCLERRPSRYMLFACVGLLFTVFAGQQGAFWLSDMEFNAGGRYLLVALPALAVLVVEGISRLPSQRAARGLLTLWVAVIVAMNLVSARRITGVLNPEYFPGWRMFEFPRR